MKCPKCGFFVSDHLNSCKKCGQDLTAEKAKLGLSLLSIGGSRFAKQDRALVPPAPPIPADNLISGQQGVSPPPVPEVSFQEIQPLASNMDEEDVAVNIHNDMEDVLGDMEKQEGFFDFDFNDGGVALEVLFEGASDAKSKDSPGNADCGPDLFFEEEAAVPDGADTFAEKVAAAPSVIPVYRNELPEEQSFRPADGCFEQDEPDDPCLPQDGCFSAGEDSGRDGAVHAVDGEDCKEFDFPDLKGTEIPTTPSPTVFSSRSASPLISGLGESRSLETGGSTNEGELPGAGGRRLPNTEVLDEVELDLLGEEVLGAPAGDRESSGTVLLDPDEIEAILRAESLPSQRSSNRVGLGTKAQKDDLDDEELSRILKDLDIKST